MKLNAKVVIALLLGILISYFPYGPINTASAHTTSAPTPDGTMSDYSSRSGFIYATPTPKYNCDTWTKGDGTTSLGGDTDGDGICNAWETANGLIVDFKTPGTYTPAPNTAFYYEHLCDPTGVNKTRDIVCPSSTKKDLYLELDWMKDSANSHVPLAGVIDNVKDAFNKAPVGSGSDKGITLHVQYGETPATDSGNIGWHKNSLYTDTSNQASYPGFYRIKQYYFGTITERHGTDSDGDGRYWTTPYPDTIVKKRLTAKFTVFHYAMIINTRAEDSLSSGWGEPGGNDLVLSLGGFNPIMGSVDHQQSTLMHELGHNLKLKHGGNENVNYKPNYLSIMSYTHQFAETYDSCRPLNYSGYDLNSLSETGLNEGSGVDNAAGTGALYNTSPSCTKVWGGFPIDVAGQQRFIYFNNTVGYNPQMLEGVDRTHESVDWNNAGGSTQTGVQQDINSDVTKTSLSSPNDWTSLVFRFIDNSYASGSSAGSGQNTNIILNEDYTNDTGTGAEFNDNGARQEVTYTFVKNIRLGHLRQLDNLILLQSNDSFKNDYNGKQKLHQFVTEASEEVGDDNVHEAYNTLLAMKKLVDDKGNSIVTNETARQQILYTLNDKVQSFKLAQDGIIEPPKDGNIANLQKAVESLNDAVVSLNNKVTDLAGSVDELTSKVDALQRTVEEKPPSGTEDGAMSDIDKKIDLFGYSIIGLVIAIIALAIALSLRNRRNSSSDISRINQSTK